MIPDRPRIYPGGVRFPSLTRRPAVYDPVAKSPFAKKIYDRRITAQCRGCLWQISKSMTRFCYRQRMRIFAALDTRGLSYHRYRPGMSWYLRRLFDQIRRDK